MKESIIKILVVLNFIFLVVVLFMVISNNHELKNVKQSLELIMNNNNQVVASDITQTIDNSWTGADDPDYLKDETTYVLSAFGSKEGFTANDKFLFIGRAQDDYGFTHKRYQHYYKGLVVDGSEYLIDEKAGQITSTGGRIIRLPEISITPVLSEAEALLKAKQYLNMKDDIVTPGQLVISALGGNYKDGPFVLCWSFSDLGYYHIYIDANSGAEVNRISNIVF